jgi:hypothetical protein
MTVELVEELVRRCRERVGGVRARDLTASEDAALEPVYNEVVAAYRELRIALDSIATMPDASEEERKRAEVAIADEHTSMMLDLFEIGYLIGARAGLRVGIVDAQTTSANRMGLLLRAIGDDATADELFADAAKRGTV